MNIDHQLFRTGVPLIDNQHETYIALLDSLFLQCNDLHIDRTQVDAALDKALAYAVEHFDAEEALMRSISYPAFEAHRAKHDEFRSEVDRLSRLPDKTSTSEDLLLHLTKWLLEWFCEQVRVHDKALAEYLKKRELTSKNK